MSAPSWGHVKELLYEAAALPPELRAKFLDEVCASDAALRAELESLLAVGDGLNAEFLEARSPGNFSADGGGFDAAGLAAGQLFAERFQLVRGLGEGGMGQVWLAEQTAPVRRPVALKLIKAGMYDETVVRRFQAERQSLAIMDHPAIAKVFDAGITPQGQPYFVMEYVPGLPITEYCDQKKLKIRERLELFIQACEGVQHAHQKAIIHRDLKPANILVVEVDGKPVPRIIDFGLAKAAAAPPADATLHTRFGQFLGTPGYMSPEQVNPNIRDIDTRTDVYSLGVILYELLTGMQPFEMKGRQRPSLEEWLRRLREEEPRRPSSQLSADRETSMVSATARNVEPKQLVRLLRGDLDWITMKALERDREQRYGTPSDLAADLRRHLNDEPVTARAASAGYRIRKYIRRHRAASAVAAGLLLLISAFSVLQAVQIKKITRERDRATRITDFMTGMFKVSDPSEARGNGVTAREILDKASTDIGKGLAQDPDVQSQMMHVMASTYRNLGLYTRAHDLAQRALDARLNVLGPDNPATLESTALLGIVLSSEGRNSEAEKLEQRALGAQRRILGLEDPLTLQTMVWLGHILGSEGHFDEQEKMERAVIETGTPRLGLESVQVSDAMAQLGTSLVNQGRYSEAEKVLRPLLDIDRRAWGADDPNTMEATEMLAASLDYQERFEEAEPLYRQALAASQRVRGAENPVTANYMSNLAGLLNAEGRLVDAERLLRETLAIDLRTRGPDHQITLMVQVLLGDVLSREGDFSGGEQMQRATSAALVRVLGPEHPETLANQTNLAATLIREGRYAEAEQIARNTIDTDRRVLGPVHNDTVETLRRLGMALAYRDRYAEASALFRDLIDKQSHSAAQGDSWSAWYDFACAAAAANQSDDAFRYLREAINHGYKDARGLATDDDLRSLRSNPKFQQLLAELKSPPAEAGTQPRKSP